jgi:hypothetical protein
LDQYIDELSNKTESTIKPLSDKITKYEQQINKITGAKNIFSLVDSIDNEFISLQEDIDKI